MIIEITILTAPIDVSVAQAAPMVAEIGGIGTLIVNNYYSEGGAGGYTLTEADMEAIAALARYDDTNIQSHVSSTSNPHTVTKSQVGLANADNTSDANKPVSAAQATALGLKLDATLKGAANGLAELDDTGRVPTAQLPSYVDDVLEVSNFDALPNPGVAGKIYVTIDTNKTYRWGGTAYTEISQSLALGETSATAYRGDRGKAAYDHVSVTSNPHGVTKTQVGLSNVDNTSDADKPVSTAVGVLIAQTENGLSEYLDQQLSIFSQNIVAVAQQSEQNSQSISTINGTIGDIATILDALNGEVI